MIVHADDARHDRVSTQVEQGGPIDRRQIRACADALYPAVFDDDVLILTRSRAGTIDDLHVFEDYLGRPDPHVLAHFWPESVRALRAPLRRKTHGSQTEDSKAALPRVHCGVPVLGHVAPVIDPAARSCSIVVSALPA